MKKIVFLFAFLGAIALKTYSQNQLHGVVTDASAKEALVGATVIVKGTTQGTISDIDGNFTLELSSSPVTLVVSYVGYKTVEIAYTGQSTVVVSLQEDISGLDEVVVVGYGTQKKSHLTGAIGKITNENLDEIPVSRIDQALSGRIAGMTIQNITTEVGVSPQIRVRGMGSISASNEPLVVVDGYPVPDGLAMVDMNDVESVEVLKDASSAAIYGSRGANGVILITTKSGQIAKPKYKVSAYTGWKKYMDLHPMMNSVEFADFRMNEEALERGLDPSFSLLSGNEKAPYVIAQNIGDTNWQKEALRTAKISNASVSVSGGVKGIRYYLSGNFTRDEGIMKKSDYEKFSVQGKIDAQLSDKVTVGLNFNPSYAKRQRPRANFTDYWRNPSFMPVRHNEYTSGLTGYEAGSYAFGRHFKNITLEDPETGEPFVASNPWGTSNNSPAYIRDNEWYYTHYYRALTNSYLTVKLFDKLEFKTSNGVYLNYTVNDIYSNANSRSEGDPNVGSYNNDLYIDLLSENTLSYNYSKGDHSISALAGATFQKTKSDVAEMEGMNFPTDYIHTLNAATTFNLEGTGTYKEKTTLVSYLARVNYDYQDKYLVSLVTRTDGSSLFGPENKWGWFPSASVGWRVTEEPFFKVKSINMLKLRASIGVTGNNDIENYAHQNTLVPANYQLGKNPSNPTAGLAQNNTILGNKSISWERTVEYNYGLDLTMFNNRFDAVINYYYSSTEDLLLKQEINSYTGYNQYWNNIGEVRNKGIEIELTGRLINQKKLKWNVGLNLSANRNRLLELGGEAQTIKQGERSEQYIAKVGDPSIQYYGYKMIGVWASAEEIAANPHSNDDAPGGIRVANLNNDDVIDANDRTILGDPFPDFTWGATTDFKIGNFDLSLLFEGTHGGEIYNGDGYYTESRKYNKEFTEDRWINAEYPGTKPFERNGRNWMFTDYLIEDGSFWTLRNVNVGYTLPKDLCRKLGISTARIFASGQNLIYVMNSDYRGINPEARSTSSTYSDPLIGGYQRGAFPLNRTYTFGINFNF